MAGLIDALFFRRFDWTGGSYRQNVDESGNSFGKLTCNRIEWFCKPVLETWYYHELVDSAVWFNAAGRAATGYECESLSMIRDTIRRQARVKEIEGLIKK
jgi:hypothetical protein